MDYTDVEDWMGQTYPAVATKPKDVTQAEITAFIVACQYHFELLTGTAYVDSNNSHFALLLRMVEDRIKESSGTFVTQMQTPAGSISYHQDNYNKREIDRLAAIIKWQ